MSTYSLPDTPEGAYAALDDLGQIATATGWKRAAIVAALVEPDLGSGGRKEDGNIASFESAAEFAKRKYIRAELADYDV